MADRPILFSGPMVRALLAGTKTQTRRPVKFPHLNPLGVWEPQTIGGPNGGRTARGETIPEQGAMWHTRTGDSIGCPYGQPGDRLWVRENTLKIEDHGWVGPVFVESAAGRDALEWGYGESDDPDFIQPYDLKVRPSIHMPRKYARLLLEITGVRVERLQAISEDDSKAEGVHDWLASLAQDPKVTQGDVDALIARYGTGYRAVYAALWESINGAGSWDANPWVWVVEFKRVTP
jgi:hypothetical protein